MGTGWSTPFSRKKYHRASYVRTYFGTSILSQHLGILHRSALESGETSTRSMKPSQPLCRPIATGCISHSHCSGKEMRRSMISPLLVIRMEWFTAVFLLVFDELHRCYFYSINSHWGVKGIMRNYSKVGGKKGKPAYRTPSSFRSRNYLKVQKRQAPFRPQSFRKQSH